MAELIGVADGREAVAAVSTSPATAPRSEETGWYRPGRRAVQKLGLSSPSESVEISFVKSPIWRIETRRLRSSGDEDIENGCSSRCLPLKLGTPMNTKVPGSYIIRRSSGRMMRSTVCALCGTTASTWYR
jgi:hypothetical protein